MTIASPIKVSIPLEDLERASELLVNLLERVEPSATPTVAGHLRGAPARCMCYGIAKRLVEARRARAAIFCNAMFGEPSWDLLLALYVKDHEGEPISVNRLAEVTQVPPTSAKRWLDYLDRERLIERKTHPADARMVTVHLTDRGRSLLEESLARFADLAKIAND